jgi:predicted RND superfamily exporter protein
VGSTGPFLNQMRAQFAAYSEDNPHGARLIEDYSTEPSPEANIVEFGFSGGYTTTYDDSNEIKSSIGPVSGFAFLGVFLVLLLFFRRHIVAVPLVIMGLIVGIILTLGFAWAAIGELNMITSILGGILMGLGIDFGIHMIYRLGEELGRDNPLETALRNTITNSGLASLVSGAGTAAAFFSLLFSEFAGFSQFGLLAGTGVLIIGVVLYLWVPVLLVLLDRWRTDLPKRMLGGLVGGQGTSGSADRRLQRPGVWLGVGVGVALVICIFAPSVVFEYNTRALMVEHQPSVMLRDEIDDRYQISADPVAVYTPTREAAKEIFAAFTPLDPERHSTVDQIVSMFSSVPPRDQQERNYEVLTDWNKELSEIDRKSLPPEFQDKWDEAMGYLAAKPYDIDGVPAHLREMFKSIPTASPENRGFLTFIYPVVDLWDGKQMLRYAEEVEVISVDSGTFNSAGAPILFAKLAKIVLFDARFSVILTFFLLLGILLLDFRRLSSTLIALTPLVLGVGVMLGSMSLLDVQLNFMNVVVFPIVLGYGLSHGVYLMHRFYEGSSPMQALSSVGTAVACSTLTTLAGWAALLAASHRGVKSMGMLACLGMSGTLLVTFMVMPAILQLLHDRRLSRADADAPTALPEETT